MTALQKLSVVIPCYNEEANIPRYSVELFDQITKSFANTEFLFIDDGSVDKTADLLEALCRMRSNARLVRHDQNRGLGMAVRTGIGHAMGDAILVFDADLTFHPGEAQKLLSAYEEGVDCVVGSPFLGTMEHVPFIRRFLSHSVNLIYCVLFGKKITAASSLFRLYRTARLKKLNLTGHSFDINAEIIFKLIEAGAGIREVPVTLLVRTGGVSKISTWREIKNHFRLFWRVLRWRLGVSA